MSHAYDQRNWTIRQPSRHSEVGNIFYFKEVGVRGPANSRLLTKFILVRSVIEDRISSPNSAIS